LLQARFQSTHLRHFDDRHHSLRLCDVCGAWLALFWVFGRRWFIERDLFPLPPPASVVPGLVRLQLRSHALFGAFLVFLCALLFLLQLPHALERTQDEGQAIGGLECSLSRHRVSLDCGILHRPANSRTPSGHPPCTPHKHSLPAADPSSPPFSPSARVQACFPETSNRSQLSNRPIGSAVRCFDVDWTEGPPGACGDVLGSALSPDPRPGQMLLHMQGLRCPKGTRTPCRSPCALKSCNKNGLRTGNATQRLLTLRAARG
jgi:hypothetical protein